MTTSHAPYLHTTQHLRATSHTQRGVYHTIPTYQLSQPLEPKQPKPYRTPLSTSTRIGNSRNVLFARRRGLALDPLIRLLASAISGSRFHAFSLFRATYATSLYC